MSDTTTTDAGDDEAPRPDVRLVLGVAVLFALLGALSTRVAGGGSLDGLVAAALALLAVTATVAVFGPGTVRAAAELLRP